MTSLHTRAARRFGPQLDTAPLHQSVFYIWAVAATALTVVGLVAAVLYAPRAAALSVMSAGISFGSLLAAVFLWQAYGRVGGRSR
jgi:hypothetical protein